MSGLLRRLAARAMGIATPLRARARLPFAAPPAPVPEVRAPSAAADRETEAPLRPQSVSLVEDGVDVATRPARPPAPLAPGPEPGVKRDPGEDPAPIATPRRTAAPGPPPRTDPPRATAHVSPTREDDAHAAATASMPPPSVSRPSATGGPHDDAPRLAAARTPPPLLPLRASDGATPLVDVAAPLRVSGASPRALVDETTEVHVSIGRIEVTAVHEAPPPKRAAARASRPMSLDEYLARRRERRP